MLRKYLWAFTDNRISVNFEYEFHDARCGPGCLRGMGGGVGNSWKQEGEAWGSSVARSPPTHPHSPRTGVPARPLCSGQWYRAYGNENWVS